MSLPYVPPFARLVYQILVRERRASTRDMAAALGLTYGAFHNRLNGRSQFTPDEISRLLRELPDIRLIECLIGQSGFIAVPLPESDRQSAMRSSTECGLACIDEVVAALRLSALPTNYFDTSTLRRTEIEQYIQAAQRELAAMRFALGLILSESRQSIVEPEPERKSA